MCIVQSFPVAPKVCLGAGWGPSAVRIALNILENIAILGEMKFSTCVARHSSAKRSHRTGSEGETRRCIGEADWQLEDRDERKTDEEEQDDPM